MPNLKDLVAKVLGVEKDVLTDDSSPDNIESWDSFNGLMLVSELETVFKVHFTIDEVLSVKNYGDIKSSLRKHGIHEGIDD